MSKQSLFYVIGAAMCIAGLVLVLAFTGAAMNVIGGVLFVLGCVAGLMFTHAPTIARRELGGFFYSPIAYILMAAYLIVVAYFFNVGIQYRAQMEQTFVIMTWLSLFMCPVITMRLLAEEARLGTLETMMTAPITDFELTIGKFVGAFLFYLILNLPTLAFVFVLSRAGKPDYGTIIASYVGIVLFGAMLISAGLLVSAFTKNQVISAFVSFVATFLLFFVGIMGRGVNAVLPMIVFAIIAALVPNFVLFLYGILGPGLTSRERIFFATGGATSPSLFVILYGLLARRLTIVNRIMFCLGGLLAIGYSACVLSIAKGHSVKLGNVITYIGAASHYMDFTRGMIMSQHVLYFITLCVFFLFLTVRTVESHRWR